MLSHKYLWWLLLVFLVGCDLNAQTAQTSAPAPTPISVAASASPAISAPSPTVAPVPAAFQLNAQAGDTQVRLSWLAVSGVSGYYIYRDGSATALNDTPITETQFVDIGLTNGRSYSYEVAAVDQAGHIGVRSSALKVSPKAP